MIDCTFGLYILKTTAVEQTHGAQLIRLSRELPTHHFSLNKEGIGNVFQLCCLISYGDMIWFPGNLCTVLIFQSSEVCAFIN